MEKSDHYYRRLAHMQTLAVPTISEVKEELGEALAEAFFSQCPDPLKHDIGLAPPMVGAGDDLWISPSDILIGKVCLKPPLTNKHMKALTHQGILMIGRDTEIKFWNEAELIKQRALAEQEEVLLFIADVQRREAVKEAHKEEWEICARAKEQMRIEFEATLKYELEQLEIKLKEDYDDLMRLQKRELDDLWQDRLEAAVEEAVKNLTAKFLADLDKHEEEMLKKFEIEVKKEQIKCKMEIQDMQDHCEETFVQLKHQLECKNISNMMYLLCMERRKCQDERLQMELHYQKQAAELQTLVTEQQVQISKLTHERNEKLKQVNLREECLSEILRQFQKFINFALRATPTQAEFLLDVEKMMMFELTETIAQTDPRHAKRLCKALFPWKADSEETLPTKSSKTSLIAEDHHHCYNELEPPVSDHSLKSNDYLPAFYYDKHMYVREEFRNMMSQGIKVSPSNLIWNRDVEHLMQILRSSVTSIAEEKVEEEETKEETTEDSSEERKIKSDSYSKRSSKSSQSSDSKTYNYRSRRSTVHFDKFGPDGNLLFPKFDPSSSSQLLHIDPSDLHNEISRKSKQDSTSDLRLLPERDCCTRCTQTLLRPLGNENEYVDKRASKSKRLSAVPLIGTVNSLELHRESQKFDAPIMRRPTALQFDEALQFEEIFQFDEPLHFEEAETHDEPFVPSVENESAGRQQDAIGILTVKDSLIKHRMSLKPTSKIFPSRDSLATEEVLELRKKSRESESQISVHEKDSKKSVEENLAKKFSRLSLSRNSVIVHKQSQIIKRQSAISRSSQNTLQQKKPKFSDADTPSKQNVKKKSSPASTKMSFGGSSIDTAISLKAPRSRLSLSKNSLELLRSQSMISGTIHGKKKGDSKESIEIRNEFLGYHMPRSSPPISIKIDDDGSKAVKMSHIEILPMKEEQGPEVKEGIAFHDSPHPMDRALDAPWLIYEDRKPKGKKLLRDNFFTKPNQVQIVGSREVAEHEEASEDFTIHRASSFLSIFRKHPSLVKIFSSCTK